MAASLEGAYDLISGDASTRLTIEEAPAPACVRLLLPLPAALIIVLTCRNLKLLQQNRGKLMSLSLLHFNMVKMLRS